ncbi:hypothetical protein AAGV28_01525 [Flavobacterium sp. FZUC8N2.13]|uniref:DUF3185 family protein n=1 Tax=Flavobacterium zubiriense TaxID=3138075 RepID=A0ABV4T7P5_9FLAO
MNLSKIIGIVLIVVSLGIGYLGLNKVQENSSEVNLLGIKIEASDESGKQEGYMYIGFAVLLFAGGIYTVNKSK